MHLDALQTFGLDLRLDKADVCRIGLGLEANASLVLYLLAMLLSLKHETLPTHWSVLSEDCLEICYVFC